MTKLRVVVLLAVVALLLFPAIAFAQGPPFPCRFHGEVQVNGLDVPDGTVITATIQGETYTATTGTTVSDGASSYEIKIIPAEGADFVGKNVTFMIGNNAAKETAIFDAGGNIKLDLSVGEPSIPVTGITGVVVNWTEGDSGIDDEGVLTLYLGEQPEGPTGPQGEKGDQGIQGLQGEQGEPGEGAPGGIALPIVALVIAIIAVGVAVMAMRRRI